MATSPAHKWGQIIGDFLEEAFEKELSKFGRKHKLYLDTSGIRPARSGKKVSWIDSFGNSHDLDFVLERGGTKKQIGVPVAFIESAWRRYTKHSRNKAQEIQGAILPLVSRHRNFAPFIGVVLAGEFTEGALNQLNSLGFNVLYFPYDLIIEGFKKFGLDASSKETTPAKDFQAKIKAWEKFSDKDKLGKQLFRLNIKYVKEFFGNLEKSVSRHITSVSITPLHGEPLTLGSIGKAIEFINSYVQKGELPILKYEITIKYNNGDKVEASFKDNRSTIEFLVSYKAPSPKKK